MLTVQQAVLEYTAAAAREEDEAKLELGNEISVLSLAEPTETLTAAC